MENENEKFGPWVGVPEKRQEICAVDGCENPGQPQICPYCQKYHHHGCVHYDCGIAFQTNHGLTFRKGAWGWLCKAHYNVLLDARVSYLKANPQL